MTPWLWFLVAIGGAIALLAAMRWRKSRTSRGFGPMAADPDPPAHDPPQQPQ